MAAAADAVDPLCSAADLQTGAYADLAENFEAAGLAQIMVEASRACETEADRRFLPFTVTEVHRADGVDVDELASYGGMNLDLAGAMGASYASALGGGIGSLARRVWVHETPARFPEMWSISGLRVKVFGSTGDTQQVDPYYVDPGTGLVWLPVGTFAPLGSMIEVTYTAGYSTIPADLRRACKYMAASILVRELDPGRSQHDAGTLEALAVAALLPYRRV